MNYVLGTVRASAWPSLFDCALRYYYEQIMGLRTPSSGAAKLGTAIHAGTAAFDRGRLDGGVPITVDDAAGVVVDELRSDGEATVWDDDLSKREAEPIGIKLTATYCQTIAPTRTYEAVELQCEALHITTEHGVIRLTGKTDRVRNTPDGKGISDLKSGKRAVEGIVEGKPRAVVKGHHLQLGVYRLMAEAAISEPMTGPDEIIGLQTSGKGHVAVAEVRNSTTPLLGTAENPGLIEIAAAMLKSGIFPPNPRSMLCSKKFCGGWDRCQFKGE